MLPIFPFTLDQFSISSLLLYCFHVKIIWNPLLFWVSFLYYCISGTYQSNTLTKFTWGQQYYEFLPSVRGIRMLQQLRRNVRGIPSEDGIVGGKGGFRANTSSPFMRVPLIHFLLFLIFLFKPMSYLHIVRINKKSVIFGCCCCFEYWNEVILLLKVNGGSEDETMVWSCYFILTVHVWRFYSLKVIFLNHILNGIKFIFV